MGAKALIVVLEHDMKDEPLERFKTALATHRNVLRVEEVPDSCDDYVIESRVRLELHGRLIDLAREMLR